MRCGLARQLSSAYLADDLDDRQRSAIRGHLHGCAECREAYHDEQQIVEAAAAQGPIDPPASLWNDIAQRLAEEEVADAERSRAWFWWRGVWYRYKAHFAGATLAAATAIALMAWPSELRQERQAEAAAGAVTASAEELSFDTAIAQEIARADARYAGSIDELMSLIDGERHSWPAERKEAFNDRLAAFEQEISRHLQDGLTGGDVLRRDALYAVYRDKIDYLSEVAMMDGLP